MGGLKFIGTYLHLYLVHNIFLSHFRFVVEGFHVLETLVVCQLGGTLNSTIQDAAMVVLVGCGFSMKTVRD